MIEMEKIKRRLSVGWRNGVCDKRWWGRVRVGVRKNGKCYFRDRRGELMAVDRVVFE